MIEQYANKNEIHENNSLVFCHSIVSLKNWK
jgi:hypothetical protein